MELTQANVEFLVSKELPLDEATIIPLGDIQYGADGAHVDLLRRTIQRGEKAGAWYIGMGDYVDVMSPSNRRRLVEADFYDSSLNALEEVAEIHRQQVLRILEPTKGRWLGMLEGHHFYKFMDGSTSDTRLARDLGCPFLGTCAMLRIVMKDKKYPEKKRLSYTIWAHHGRGGGMKAAAPLNKLENLAYAFDADMFLLGHYTKKGVVPLQRISMTRVKPYQLEHKDIHLVATGGYLKGYMAGSQMEGRPQGSYVEQGMMAPVALGSPVVRLRPHYESGKSNPIRLEATVEV